MFNRRTLTKRLSELGYREIGPLQYELASTESAVIKYLSFRLLGVYRWKLEGTVGFKHVEAEAFSRYCLRAFGGDWWKQALSNESPLPFVVQCYLSKVASWPAGRPLEIKGLTAEASADRVKRDVEEFVRPFVSRIDTPRSFLEFLLADEEPMPWYQWGPLLRLAQVVYLVQQEGLPDSVFLPAIELHRQMLSAQLRGVELDTYATQVVEAAKGSAWRRVGVC